MDGIKRVSRKGVATNHASSVDHRRLQKSSTLNRKFVKKPAAKPKVSMAASAAAKSLQRQGYQQTILQKNGAVRLQPTSQQRQAGQQQATKTTNGVQQQAVTVRRTTSMVAQQRTAGQKTSTQQRMTLQQQQQMRAKQQQLQQQKQQQEKDVFVKNAAATAARQRQIAKRQAAQGGQQLTAQQLKDRAIQQALNKMNSVDAKGKQQKGEGVKLTTQFTDTGGQKQHFWQNRKLVIAGVMAVVSICLLGYLVHLNLPDISVRVAAMQTGIEKAYPSYVPATYRLDGLVGEDNGRITMNFKNDQGHKFTLMEEKSSWDSAAVLANYVKKNWGDDYSVAKGQGLTIYISDSNAAWVNGGVLYIITDSEGHLTSSDLHDIAVSL